MSEFDITEKILETSSNVFGIRTLKPFQILVMQRIMEQESGVTGVVRNQLVILPTGTGKSLIFMVSALLCKGITVIVYPLLALMADQQKTLERCNVLCVCIRGGQTKDQRNDVFRKLDEGCKIVITNPETLMQKRILQRLSKYKVSLLVVDEAHVISQWAKSFRPAYSELGQIADVLKPRQRLAFTATAGEKIVEDIRSCIFKEKPLIVRGDADRENIMYSVFPCGSRIQGMLQILRFCKRKAIVFCGTRKNTVLCALKIKYFFKKIDVRYYHAGLSKEERKKIENWFSLSSDGVLCCTCAYGMGVDVRSVRTVIHIKAPETAAEFMQESGRAGRDGLLSFSYVVITPEDYENKKNNDLLSVFTGNKCRRSALLSLLDQNKEECTGCDVCAGTVINGFSDLDTLVEVVKRYPLRFTCESLCSLLCGHQFWWKTGMKSLLNPYYGILKDYDYFELIEGVKVLIGKQLKLCNIGSGKELLYPEGSFVYNTIALVMEKIFNGYSTVIRKLFFTE